MASAKSLILQAKKSLSEINKFYEQAKTEKIQELSVFAKYKGSFDIVNVASKQKKKLVTPSKVTTKKQAETILQLVNSFYNDPWTKDIYKIEKQYEKFREKQGLSRESWLLMLDVVNNESYQYLAEMHRLSSDFVINQIKQGVDPKKVNNVLNELVNTLKSGKRVVFNGDVLNNKDERYFDEYIIEKMKTKK